MTGTPAPLLTDTEFAVLSVREQAEYLSYLQASLESWQLTDKQAEFDAMADRCKSCLIGGAAGPGKSEWALYRADRLSREIPGHRTLILRRSFPELRRSMIQRSVLRIKPADATYRVGDKEWHYHNGSVIEFGYLDSDESVGIYQSAEYQCVIFDEAAEFTPYMLQFLSTRIRVTYTLQARGARPHVIFTSNPGGPGHAWLRKTFILPIGTSGGERTDDNGDHIGFMPGFARDNPHLDSDDYERTLSALPPIMRRRFLQGDWSAIEGQFFIEWDQDHHVVAPFEIPASWRRARGIDYGYIAPFACVWIAWDGDGRAYVYDEAYERNLAPRQQAALIKERGAVNISVADPAIFTQTGVGPSVASQYAAAGVHAMRAKNARVDGWANARQYLAPMKDERPGLLVFSTCTELIRSLPDLQYSKSNPEDVDTTGDDHLADALRYALAAHPRRPRRPDAEPARTDMQARADAHQRQQRRRRHKTSLWQGAP